MATRPQFRCFPDDDDFTAAVNDRASRIDFGDIDADQKLEAALREDHLLAVVRPQHELAQPLGERSPLWYVYRYGTQPPAADHWYDKPGLAAITIDSGGIQVAMNDAAEGLIGYPRAAVIGAPVGAVLAPQAEAAPEDAARLWAAFIEDGIPLNGTFRVPRPDGTSVELEYHVSRDGDGPGRHRAVFRASRPSVRLLFADRQRASQFASEIRRLTTVGADLMVVPVGGRAKLEVPATVWEMPLVQRLVTAYGGSRATDQRAGSRDASQEPRRRS